MEKSTAVVLAAGQGKRMQSKVAKQFMDLCGKPLICYALEVFEKSAYINEIVLVTNQDALDYCQQEIVDKYGYRKVKTVIPGGKERYDSVYQGLLAAGESDFVYIHDGARPFVTEELISDLYTMVRETYACVAAVPVKDTIKRVDPEGYSVETPNRAFLWQIQTPQVFDLKEIRLAYKKMYECEHADVTDDAMVMERYGNRKIKMCKSNYQNIKITTPEDLLTAEAFLKADGTIR